MATSWIVKRTGVSHRPDQELPNLRYSGDSVGISAHLISEPVPRWSRGRLYSISIPGLAGGSIKGYALILHTTCDLIDANYDRRIIKKAFNAAVHSRDYMMSSAQIENINKTILYVNKSI